MVTGGDPSEKFVEKVIEHLPVKQLYNDALSGATKQVGHSLTDVAKCVRFVLLPFRVGAALYERVEKFIDGAVRRVPEEQRISPAPQVVGPVLEGIRYEPEGTPIDAMFSQLLSRSMDSKRVNEAHPAFPVLIRQLSEDEAKILKSLCNREFDYVFTLNFSAATATVQNDRNVEVDDLPKGDLTFPQNIPFCFEHLDKLGLAHIAQHGAQEPIYTANPTVPKYQVAVRVRCKYRLTELGRRFVHACVGEDSA